MKFALENIEIEVFLGVPDEERAEKQAVLISLFWEFDTQKAELSDNVADSVDYFEIYQFVKNFPNDKSFKLIEKLYRELFDILMKKFPINNLKIEITKFPFPDSPVTIKN